MQTDEDGHSVLPKGDYRRCEWPGLELTEFQWRIIDSIVAEGGLTGREGILKYCESCDYLTAEEKAKRRDGSTVHRHINSLVAEKVLDKVNIRIPGYKRVEKFRVNWPESKPSPESEPWPAKRYRDFVPG